MNNNTNTSNLPQTTTTTPTKQSIPIRNTPTNGTNTPIPTKGTITSTETEPKTTKNTSIDEKVVLSSSTKLVSSDTDTVLLQNRYHPTDNIKNSTMSDDGHDATVDELPSPPKSSNTTTSIHNYNNKSNNCNYVVVVRSLTVSCIGYLYQWLVIAPVNIFGYIVGNQHIPTDSQQQQQQQQSNGITNTITTSIVSKRNSATTTSSLQPESKSQPKINEGKYIPPQLRGGGGSGGGGKYIPPQRRKQMEAELQQKQQQNQPQDSVVVVTAAIQNPHSASSIHQHHPPSKRLGGCADPTLIRGSICDEMYIPKKASEVGSKVHSESFGSLGGLPSSSRHRGSENGTKQITNDNNTNNNIQWEVGAVSKCGLRSSNEDSYIVVNDLLGSSSSSSSSSSSVNEEQSQQPTISATRKKEDDESSSLSASDDINSSFFKSHQSHGIFAIFDGHCGNQTARFAAEKFPSILLDESRNDDFLTTITATNKTEANGTTDGGGQSLAAANNNSNTIEEANVCTLLQNTVARLDHEFCRISMADGRQWDCGATALIAIVIEDTLVVAGLGDSNGVICCAISPDDSDDGGGGDVVGEEDGWTILKEEGRDEPTKTNNAYSSSLGDNDDSKQQNHVHPRGVTVILKEVVNPHNPSREDERTRIENANGWVVTDPEQISRVCGDLAVSRSLGDREFKAAYNMSMAQQNSSYNGGKNPNSFTGAILQDNTIAHKWGSEHLSEEYRLFPTPEKGHHFIGDVISAVPEINSFQLGRRRTNRVIEEFLLLACDGLWDVMSVVDVTRLTRKLLFRKGLTAEASADYLVEHAFSLGSRDNVTVIIVRFYGNDSTSR